MSAQSNHLTSNLRLHDTPEARALALAYGHSTARYHRDVWRASGCGCTYDLSRLALRRILRAAVPPLARPQPVQSILAQCGDAWDLDPDYIDALHATLTYGKNAAANLDGGDCWYAPTLPFGA